MVRIVGSSPHNRWENEVLKRFRQQFPADWVVLPSVSWTLMRGGHVRDGEADFVVLAPGLGLVVVEVKGSKEFKVDEAGIWRRREPNGSWCALGRSPPEQAMGNMHTLIEVLVAKCGWREFPGRFAYLVVYPQGETDDLGMFDESTVATRRHMNQLTSRIRNALDRRGPLRAGEPFTSSIVEQVIDRLKNRKFHLVKVDAGEDVGEDQEKVELLTKQQFATLRGLFELWRVAVIGPAGSGKTLLALWKLKALIEEGKRAIYVCYNRQLADFLRHLNSEYSASIFNVDSLFLTLCRGADIPVEGGLRGRFFREDLPGLVVDQRTLLEGYEAIVIDEGQDFSEYQLLALHAVI